MLNDFFKWYKELCNNSNAAVIVATITGTFAFITLFLNFIFIPLFKFIINKLKFNNAVKEKNKDTKRQTYNQVSENLGAFNKTLDSLKSPEYLKSFKEVSDSQKTIENETEKIRLSLKKIKEESEKHDKKINEFKITLGEESPEERKNTLHQIDISKEELASMLILIEEQQNNLDALKAKNSEIKIILNDFKINRQQEIYEFDKKVKSFYIGFNDIVNLHIISSKEVLGQIELIKKEALAFQLFLSSLILDNEKFPDIPEILPSKEMQNLVQSISKLTAIMRMELE